MMQNAKVSGALALLFSILLITPVLGQKKEEVPPAQELPGHFMWDYGLMFLTSPTEYTKNSPIRSQSTSFTYLYSIQLGDTKFSVNPGVGISFDKISFAQPVIPLYDTSGVNPTGGIIFDSLQNVYPGTGFVRSHFNVSYLDVPVEFRWESNYGYKRGNWYVALGGYFGIRYASKHTLRYEDLETKELIRDESWQLNRYRYGAHMRLGISWFNVYGKYNFSPLWTPSRGPENANGQDTGSTTWQVGVSFDIF